MPSLINTKTSQRYELSNLLEGGWTTFGRAQTHKFTPDRCTSRYHATIIRRDKCFVLVDHSLNGTRVQTEREYRTNSAPSACLKTVLFPSVIVPEQSRSHVPEPECRHAVIFDRTTNQSYAEAMRNFVKAIEDPEQRANYFSLGFELKPGMQFCFGGAGNAPIYKFIE
ncbi:MAG: FHA domain-containing protein [Candidatus Woesearchaeota archaeon]|nr:FHA domain-containing protein [Candidatus Woesearchaeota archaeon]